MAEAAPKLAPPGAGIPLRHRLYVRYVVLPKLLRKRDWDTRQKSFRREGDKVLELLRATPAPRLSQRALIEPMVGLEDSSRHWSVLMAVEHLITVGDQMSELILGLSQGQTGFAPADPAKVKPSGALTTADGVDKLRAFLDRFDRRVSSVQNRQSRFRFRHPWFGQLTAAQWHVVALLHQGLHRRQCEAIVQAVVRASGPASQTALPSAPAPQPRPQN